MLINPRLSVLCLVVGSFMGLWSGDKQPSIETVIAQAMAEKREMLAQATPTSDATETEAYEATTVAVQAQSPELALPDHIAPGFYRAVNHMGEAHLLQVSADAINRHVSARDFYTHEADGKRWYLIRLNSPAAIATGDKQQVIR